MSRRGDAAATQRLAWAQEVETMRTHAVACQELRRWAVEQAQGMHGLVGDRVPIETIFEAAIKFESYVLSGLRPRAKTRTEARRDR